MLNQNRTKLKNITCIGAGTIGGGLDAWFLSRVTTDNLLHDDRR